MPNAYSIQRFFPKNRIELGKVPNCVLDFSNFSHTLPVKAAR